MMKKRFVIANEKSSKKLKNNLEALKVFSQTLTLAQLNDRASLTDKQLSWIATHLHALTIDEETDLNQLWVVEGEKFSLAYLIIHLIAYHAIQQKYDFPPYIDCLLNYNLAEPYKNFKVWNLLSRSKSLGQLMAQLLDKGYFPTPETLNAIVLQGPFEGLTTWYWLASSNHALFQQLLKQDIYPSAEALNFIIVKGFEVGLTTWYRLALHETGRAVFQQLLNKDIYPSAEALNSLTQGLYASLNTWNKLADSVDTHPLLQQLLDKGIKPEIASFSPLTHGRCTWDYLKHSPVICTFIAQQILLPKGYLLPLWKQGYQLAERFKTSLGDDPQSLEGMYQDSLEWIKLLETHNIVRDSAAALVIFWYHLNSLENYQRALMRFTLAKTSRFQCLWDRAAWTFYHHQRWQALLDTLPYVTDNMDYEKISLALVTRLPFLDDQVKQMGLKATLRLSLSIENSETRRYCLERIIPALVENTAWQFDCETWVAVENFIQHLTTLSLAECQQYNAFPAGLFYPIELLKIMLQSQLAQQERITEQQSQLTVMIQKIEQLSSRLDGEPILNLFNSIPAPSQEERLTSQPDLKH